MSLEQLEELLLNDPHSADWSLDALLNVYYNQQVNFESALVSDKTEEHDYGSSLGETDKTSQIDQNQISTPEAAQTIPSGTIESDSIDQDQAFFTSGETTQDVSQIRGTKTEEEDEAEEASKTYQTPRKPETAQAIHHAGVFCELRNGAWPRTKVNSRTRCLNQQTGNTLPNYRSECESDASDLKGKATLGSTTPLTPIEKKRLADQKYRNKKREENINLQNVVRSLSQQNGELKERLQYAETVIEQRMNQPKFPMKRRAVFELNFHDDESKAEAMTRAAGLPGMVEMDLNVKKRRLKLKGGFDAGAVLNKICDTRLVSKENVSSTPGPSTGANLRVSAKKLR